MMWRVPCMWEGGDVWIIGGGPSVVTQFDIPEDVVLSVLHGTSPLSVYSPYLEAIHNKHVIAVNIAYQLGDWIDMVFFGDVGFFLKHKPLLAQFPGLKVSCHAGTKNETWVKFLTRDGKRPRGISTSNEYVSWNGNSGGAAISVAAHAGAKRIILLGFDMKINERHAQHWHNAYGLGKIDITDEKVMRKLPFDRHLRCFPEIAVDAEKRGIEIINASPDSAITCFPKMNVKDLL